MGPPKGSTRGARAASLLFGVLGFSVLRLVESSGAAAATPHREYAPRSQSTAIYRPRQVEIRAAGLVNEAAVYFETPDGVSALHDGGFLTPLLEVDDANIKAFHLCHHRNSIFYEVLAREGGGLTIFEYSLAARSRARVREFQDAAPATSLACVDQLLLRASQANLMAISLQQDDTPPAIVQTFHAPDGSDVLTSLAVGFAADVFSQAQIYAVAPGNRSLLQMGLAAGEAGGHLYTSSKALLEAGPGDDGPLAHASVRRPGLLAWAQGRLLFTDFCAVREVSAERYVRTLLGSPLVACSGAGNETLEPVPWASRLSDVVGLAGAADGTAAGAALAVTRAQVVRMAEVREDVCADLHHEDCTSHAAGCGFAEGASQSRCMSCSGLQQWAGSQLPPLQLCSLEAATRAGVRYSLVGCGCQPAPEPEPDPDDPGSDAQNTVPIALQVVVGFVLLAVLLAVALLLYRASRRAAAAREMYGVDTAEFHTFTDDL